jgi:hypothetical protein
MAYLIWLGLALIVAWVVAWALFHVTAGAIHLLLVVGAIMVIGWVARRFIPAGSSTA